MKITRIELCHPVNRPGKHDDTLRALSVSDGWELGLWTFGGRSDGVRAAKDGGELYIPMTNIRSIS